MMIKILYNVLVGLLVLCTSIGCKTNGVERHPTSAGTIESEGDDDNIIPVGSKEALLQAIANAKAGDLIVLKGSSYLLNEKIEITSSGSEAAKITLMADPKGERAQLDFSSMSENSSNQGIELKADFWHIKGIDIFNAGDNGMLIKGSNNVIEFCTFSECSDSGLQLDNGAANNTILNCDSYFNADSKIENADGFACKLRVGNNNKFIACRAWNNLDDGWDGYLRENDNITTIYEDCWAIQNGFGKDGIEGEGDGNGFKTGGSDTKDLKHHAIYKNCVAVGNVADGFDHNSNRGTVTMYNCIAYENGTNLNFSNTNPLGKLIIKNSAVVGEVGSVNATDKEISHNSWTMEGVVATEADYQSLETQQLKAPRKADGSLPEITFMHLQPTSDLIDKGVDVGLPFAGSAPDLNAFEYEND